MNSTIASNESLDRVNGRATVVLTVLGAAALAAKFVLLLARYYAFYHLRNAGTGMGLLFVVLPAAVLVTCAVALLVRHRTLRRGASVTHASLSGVAVAALMLALLFSLELWRTSAMRGGEGPGTGDLAPFVRNLVGL
jgi:hypothetical protein